MQIYSKHKMVPFWGLSSKLVRGLCGLNRWTNGNAWQQTKPISPYILRQIWRTELSDTQILHKQCPNLENEITLWMKRKEFVIYIKIQFPT